MLERDEAETLIYKLCWQCPADTISNRYKQ